MAEYMKYRRKNNPRLEMLRRAQQRAKRRGLEFNLELDDIVIPDSCPVLGIPLKVGGNKERDNAPSLDRINNKKGYIKSNVIVVSSRANRLKSDSSLEELKAIVSFYSSR